MPGESAAQAVSSYIGLAPNLSEWRQPVFKQKVLAILRRLVSSFEN